MRRKILKIFFLSGIGVFFVFFAAFPANADVINQKKVFFVDPGYDFYERNSLGAVLIKTTNNIYFYVDENWWNSSDKANVLKSLDGLGLEFSTKIYPVLVSNFGPEWNPGIDNDSKITVLIHKMRNEAGAYFREQDEYSVYQNSSSNEREMIYINSDYIETDYAKSLLAHDFVHLITFNQKNRIYGINEDTWLNEARAEYAPTLLGYDDSPGENNNLQRRINAFLQNSSEAFMDWSGTKYDYAAANIFIQYLVDHYGKEILIDSLKSPEKGVDSIDRALAKNKFNTDLSRIFLDWSIAVYLNDCNYGGKYCYKNFNLRNLFVIPQTNFLPLSGESTLSFADNLKNWSVNWYKIIGGKENIKVVFEGKQQIYSRVPYILRKRSGEYLVNFMAIGENNKAEITVKDFSKDIISITIIPVVHNKNLDNNLYYSFFWSASISKNVEEEQLIIQQLLAQIEYLKKEIAKLQGKTDYNGTASCVSIKSNLSFGSRGVEVSCIQEFLKNQGPEIYPEGAVSGYFGNLTRLALIKFQEKYSQDILAPLGLSRGTGLAGPSTRNKINSMLATP